MAAWSSRHITTSQARKVCSAISRRSLRRRRCRSCSTIFRGAAGSISRRKQSSDWRATVQNIVSIKEASGSVDRVSELRGRLPDAFTILSGDDSLTLPFWRSARSEWSASLRIFSRRKSVRSSARYETGDAEIRAQTAPQTAAAFQGSVHRTESGAGEDGAGLARAMSAECRLPLCEMSEANEARLRKTLDSIRARNECRLRVLLVGAKAGWEGDRSGVRTSRTRDFNLAASCDPRRRDRNEDESRCDVAIDFSSRMRRTIFARGVSNNAEARSSSARPAIPPNSVTRLKMRRVRSRSFSLRISASA